MRGISRIELLVVIVVIALLIALLLPAVQQAREAALRSQSKNTLKQQGLALHNYHESYNCFPAGGTFDAQGRGYHGWMVSIAPYMDASSMYGNLDLNQPWDSPRNAGRLMFSNRNYQNPGQKTPVGPWEFNLAHYSANSHLLAANSGVRLKDIESQEQTFIAAELAGDFVPWACPYNWRPLTTLNGTPATYGRYSKNGCHCLFVDGHVQFISNDGFAAVKDSLRGPDLAGFGETPANIIRPKSFPVPKDALVPDSIPLSGEPDDNHRWADGMKNYRGQFVHLTTFRGITKWEPVVVHDADIATIAAHHELEELVLSGDFTDAALPTLRNLTQLRVLHLESDRITEPGLAVVEQLPKLQVLELQGQQITEELRQRVQARLPHCDVRRIVR